MHPVSTMKHWSHVLHDSIVEHIHSRHFWVGVVIALCFAGILALLFILARSAPIIYPHHMPYAPYM